MRLNYQEMTRAQRRVAIAQDVIKNLGLMKICSSRGYVRPNNFTNGPYVKRQLEFGVAPKDIALKALKSCALCVRGAMMLCKVAKFNQYDFAGVLNVGHIKGHDTLEALKDAFTENELLKIESCFEIRSFPDLHQKETEKHLTNWSNILDDKDRLQAIMQNIVDHNGWFKPSVAYEILEV